MSDYFDHPAMSQSKMKVLLENPRIFYLKYITKEIDDKPTVSKNLGNCLDLALTEPEKYADLKVKDTKTTAIEGFITKDWKTKIDIWMNSLNNYKFENDFFDGLEFGKIVKSCQKQFEAYYTYQNIEWKMKADYANIKNGFFIDVKSTKATSYEEFIKDFINYGYHIQAASYALGLQISHNLSVLPTAYYIAVSTVTGEVFAVECSDSLIELGIKEINRGCQIYKTNLETNDWSKNKKMQVLNLPAWKEQQIINNVLGVKL